MNKRPVDKTKKSNIKCEHCRYVDKPNKPWEKYWCTLYQIDKNYWNRCKKFEWMESECVE